MHVYEKAFSVSRPLARVSLDQLRELTREQLEPDETPVRFIVMRSDQQGFDCEIGVLSNGKIPDAIRADRLFEFERRRRWQYHGAFGRSYSWHSGQYGEAASGLQRVPAMERGHEHDVSKQHLLAWRRKPSGREWQRCRLFPDLSRYTYGNAD